jgi:hypothetical protein
MHGDAAYVDEERRDEGQHARAEERTDSGKKGDQSVDIHLLIIYFFTGFVK